MSDNKPLRVGFIGTGWSDRIQIPAFQLGGLQVQAVASGHVENARRVAERHHIPEVYQDWQALVESDTVDVVSITTPPHLHREMAVAALQAGKHVICEKPMGLDIAEAEAMLAAAQAAPNQLAIIDHELRFTPQRQSLRRLFRENYVGHAIWVELTWRSPHRLDAARPWNWWSDAAQGGGVLNAIGSHLLDLGRWLFGRINTVSAQLKIGHAFRHDPSSNSERRVSADDHAHVMLQFSNGISGTITASAVSPGSPGMTITLYGTNGVLRLDEADRLWGMQGEALATGTWSEIEVADPVRAMPDLPAQTGFARGSVYLARALSQTLGADHQWIPEAASFYDGLKVQQMLDAAWRSQKERIWVSL